jgi:hypothetical protein
MRGGRIAGIGIVALLVAVPGGSWLVDYSHSAAVRITAHTTPRILPADGQATGALTIDVRNGDGSPRAGDMIEILNLTSRGQFDRTRAITDRQGAAVFMYTTSLSNIYQPAGPVAVQVTDTSLGSIVEVDKIITIAIDTVDPAKYKKGS